MHPGRALLIGISLAIAPASALGAGSATVVCDSCESCTTALSVAGARVELGVDVQADAAGACVVIKGEGARFEGLEHTVRVVAKGATTGVQVAAKGVLVRNVHVVGARVGIEVHEAARALLFHDTVDEAEVAVKVLSSDEVQISRSMLRARGVGVSFGADDAGACGATTMKSAAAVLRKNHIEGAKVGVSACDALPVLVGNVITKNEVGLSLAAVSPRKGQGEADRAPFDPCLCAPSLDGVTPKTTLFYSSGCGGCQVHEGFMPEVKQKGHDIRAREAGVGLEAKMQAFDDYVERCAPQVADVLGVPGCVPNYTCLASGKTFKVRDGDRSFKTEAQLTSAETVAAFAEECEASAGRRYQAGAGCVKQSVAGNQLCGNSREDVRAQGKVAGDGNACDKATGFGDEGLPTCASRCTPTLASSFAMPLARGLKAASGASPAIAQGSALPPRPAPTASAPKPAASGAASPEPAAPEEGSKTLPFAVAGALAAWVFGRFVLKRRHKG